MKRSEAVKEVFYILENIYSHPEANAKTSEEILSALEKVGMLPPATEIKLGKNIYIDNAWEQE